MFTYQEGDAKARNLTGFVNRERIRLVRNTDHESDHEREERM